jgi:NADH-quinone oxidoreductase subunit H
MDFILLSILKTAIAAPVLLGTLAYLVWIERKVLAHVQLRMGPSRVGPHGLLQPIADAIKLLTKEDFIPSYVNHVYYWLAPWLALMFAVTAISVLPVGPIVEIFGVKTNMGQADISIGLLLILGLTGMGVYGIALAGWSSNNKYSLLGGLRSSAQMISYELPMALAIASPLLIVNSLNLREIVNGQAGHVFGIIPNWNAIGGLQIFSFIIYLICAFAETNRIPFDLPEAENELVSGYNTEYSSMKFAAFFMAEYANIITACSVATTLFLGGWHPIIPNELGGQFIPTLVCFFFAGVLFYHALNPARPSDRLSMGVIGAIILGLGLLFQVPVVKEIAQPLFWFASKAGFLIFVFIWVRGTVPRFRYDQLMRFAWLVLFPAALLNLLLTAFVVAAKSN